MDRDDYLDHLDADVERFAAALDSGPLDAPVPWCGEWRVADLGVHLGGVQRWATGVITGRRDLPPDPAPADGAGMAAWFRAGGASLLDALRVVDLDAEVWNPFPVDNVGAVWPRRQAQEASVHRWDVEHSIGLDPSIDPALAADGIDEYFVLALPRLMTREGVGAPSGSLLVRATDTGDEWHIAASGSAIVPATGDPSTTISGTAEQLLLTLWRRPIPDGAVDVAGDRAWIDLGGM